MNSEPPEQSQKEPDEAARKIASDLNRLARFRKLAAWIPLTPALCLPYLVINLLLRNHVWQPCFAIASLSVMFVGVGPLFYFRSRCDKMVMPLQYLDDVTCIGALLDVISFDAPTLISGTEDSLDVPSRSTPRVAGTPPEENQRDTLYSLLRSGNTGWDDYRHVTLNLAILKALEQVEDKEAIPYVERMVKDTQYAEVRVAARECLGFLRQRAEQQSVSGTLLRPSDVENAAPETLLRASVSRLEEAPELLLRANAAPDQRNP